VLQAILRYLAVGHSFPTIFDSSFQSHRKERTWSQHFGSATSSYSRLPQLLPTEKLLISATTRDRTLQASSTEPLARWMTDSMDSVEVDHDYGLKKLLPAVRLTRLPSALLKFPPSPEPQTLPPPPKDPNFAHPFSIPTEWYNALLSPYVPITIAIIYATTVTFLNSVNARRKWKPWAISRSPLFRLFVILHNVILAVYSAWTFLGMLNALRLSLPNWQNEHGAPGVVDALCKIQGPRGMGSAATYNEETSAWTMTNRAFHLAADGLGPERTDVGRIWNEGLAFYGWLFYLSKFYEVIDTAIILAKGKKSSFLQTYHHAGAMLCMWAGIRYMSPPIWMFVFVNSFIHALMVSTAPT
jgi:hypothetical protein